MFRVLFLLFFVYCIHRSTAQVSISIGGNNIDNNAVVNVVEGENLVFVCSTSDNSADIGLSTNPNVPNIDSGPLDSTRTFTANSVQRSSQDARVTCSDQSQSKSFTLNVQFPPSYSFTPAQYTGFEGDPLTVNVSVVANPLPTTVTWTKDGVNIDNSESVDTMLTSISFDSLRRSDGGMYSISANNGVGNGSSSFSLTVYFDIQFAAGNNGSRLPIRRSIGSRFTVNCSLTSTGSNPPAVTVYIITPDGGRLNVTSTEITVANDGTYTCMARTPVQTASISFVIDAREITPSQSSTVTSSMMTPTTTSTMMTASPSETPTKSSGCTYFVSMSLLIIVTIIALLLN